MIQESQRQVGLVFPNGMVPDDLITVHIRWGDKFWEMDLPTAQDYVDAVRSLLPHNESDEDPSSEEEDDLNLEGVLIRNPDVSSSSRN